MSRVSIATLRLVSFDPNRSELAFAKSLCKVLAVAAGCYVAQRIAIAISASALQFTVGWLPSAILVGVLLYAPRNTWWLNIAAAGAGITLALAGESSFATLLTQAAIGIGCCATLAYLLCRFSPAAIQLNQITKESNSRIEDLAAKLLAAQEAERARIARELHDGVSQQVAALSISLSNLKRKVSASDAELLKDLSGLQQHAMQLAEDLRNLSHDLHPAVLRHSGLVPALKQCCDDLRRDSGLDVEFLPECPFPVSSKASVETSHCLYRVAQEALRNISRHACAQRVHVSLGNDRKYMRLCIRDDGRGFDVQATRSSSGLGLISIDERVRLARGTLTIESGPRIGTEIRVQVPRSLR
ncbi:MAG TPA: sensor histidine kinase [Humisphaera sp.]|jgi:signal transduction histidine kinase|nr:sensor histidine kinase [Humisphaera sp.]